MIDFDEFKRTLHQGKVIQSVERAEEGDEGFVIKFFNGPTLQVYYSSCEGITKLDDVEVDVESIPMRQTYNRDKAP